MKVDLKESVFTPIMEENLRDIESGVIRNVKIIGKVSKNGRVYSDEALKNAVPLYENAPVYIDHPSRMEAKTERSLREQVGNIRDPRWTPDGNYGDLHLYQNHADYKLLVERATKDKNGFGLSHNADGECRRTKGGEICESIENVRSVDIVGKPATTIGLFESEDPDRPKEKTMQKFSLKKLVESYGSASEKKHLMLLEDAAVLDREVELEEPEEGDVSLADGFRKAVADIHASDLSPQDKIDEIAKVLAAEGDLKNGPSQEAVEETEDTAAKLESVQAELREMKLKDEVRTLCESESFKADDDDMKVLCLLESNSDRVNYIQKLKDKGRPATSRRREVLEDVGSYEEELAKLQAGK